MFLSTVPGNRKNDHAHDEHNKENSRVKARLENITHYFTAQQHRTKDQGHQKTQLISHGITVLMYHAKIHASAKRRSYSYPQQRICAIWKQNLWNILLRQPVHATSAHENQPLQLASF
jgi:hypothetical protein